VSVIHGHTPNDRDTPSHTKPCTVSGCTGTMHFHSRRDVALAEHTLEWPWYASWVCAANPAHFQLITDAER
jgi:hypothetical protein